MIFDLPRLSGVAVCRIAEKHRGREGYGLGRTHDVEIHQPVESLSCPFAAKKTAPQKTKFCKRKLKITRKGGREAMHMPTVRAFNQACRPVEVSVSMKYHFSSGSVRQKMQQHGAPCKSTRRNARVDFSPQLRFCAILGCLSWSGEDFFLRGAFPLQDFKIRARRKRVRDQTPESDQRRARSRTKARTSSSISCEERQRRRRRDAFVEEPRVPMSRSSIDGAASAKERKSGRNSDS